MSRQELAELAREGKLQYPDNSDLRASVGKTILVEIDPKKWHNPESPDGWSPHITIRPFHTSHPATARYGALFGWRWPRVLRQHAVREAVGRHPDIHPTQWQVEVDNSAADAALEKGYADTLVDAYVAMEGRGVWFVATYLGGGERKSRNDLAVIGEAVRYVEELTDKEREEVDIVQKVDYQSAILEEMAVPGRPRRIHADFYGSDYVDRFRRGQKLHVYGVYVPVAEKKKREIESAEQTFRYKIEVLFAKAIDEIAESWTGEDIALFRESMGSRGVRGHLEALTNSLAFVVRKNHHAKLACLMSAVGGVPLEAEPPNIHALLIGDPGTGKSAIMRAALDIMPNSTLADAQGISARGLTFGTEEWGGEKIVSAGLMVLYNHIGIEEVGEAAREHFAAMKEAMSSQVISYNVTNAKIREEINCSLIMVGNPRSGAWDDSVDWKENFHPVPVAIITRANCLRVQLDEDFHARSVRMARKFMGMAPPADDRPEFTEAQLAHWVDYASRLKPAYAEGCFDAITSFLKSFWGSHQRADASAFAQGRMIVNLWRNAAAIAKLCGSETVEVDHALEAIEFFSACMKSMGISVGDAPTELAADAAPTPENRRAAFERILRDLDERHGIRGFDMMAIHAEMKKHPNHWPTDRHVDGYWYGRPGMAAREELLYKARNAGGNYRVVDGGGEA